MSRSQGQARARQTDSQTDSQTDRQRLDEDRMSALLTPLVSDYQQEAVIAAGNSIQLHDMRVINGGQAVYFTQKLGRLSG